MARGGLFLRKLRAMVSDQPTGFVWVEKGKVAASGYPASTSQLAWLVGHGIESVLTLTEEPLPREWVNGLRLAMRHVPMKDHAPPEQDDLQDAVSFMKEELGQGRTVLVHCLAGEGRTGCVLAAYLMKDRGIGADEAVKILRQMKPAFVERSQEKAVSEYAARLGEASLASG